MDKFNHFSINPNLSLGGRFQRVSEQSQRCSKFNDLGIIGVVIHKSVNLLGELKLRVLCNKESWSDNYEQV